MAKAKEKSLEEQLADLGLSTNMEVPDPKFYSTGNMALDIKLGGGIAVGKVATLAGPNASGKTTTAISTAAGIIEEGLGKVGFFDLERAIDKPYFRALGVDPDDHENFKYFAPKTLEQTGDAIRLLVKTGEYRLIIVDSVARLVTQSELEGSLADITVMDRAKMLYKFHRMIVDDLADNDCTLIWLNHLLEKVDMTWAGKQKASRGIKEYTSPGGNSLNFFSSQILWFDKKGKIEKKEFDPLLNEEVEKSIGYKHEIFVKKNKVGKDGALIEVINIMGEGFSQTRTAMEVLKAYGVVTNAGSWYTIHEPRITDVIGDQKLQGEESVYKKIFLNPEAKGVALTMAREFLAQNYDDFIAIEDDDDSELLTEGTGSLSG